MSMPVSRGAPISLRLPTSSDAKLRAEAKALGRSVGIHAAMILMAHTQADTTNVAS